MYINNRLNNRNNNFDTIRFFAATAVIFSHSYPITGKIEPATPFYQNTWGGLGVGIFLIISGFLVAQSWERSNYFWKFMWNRILRIFPALLVAILLTVFVLGPIVTSIPLKDYFNNTQTYEYLKMVTLYNVQYHLPGVFNENPYPSTINGSLWTLEYEFTFYIILALLGISKLFYKKWFVLFIFLLSLTFYSFNAFFDMNFYTLQGAPLVLFFSFFFAGVLCYSYRDKIYLSKEYALISVSLLILSIYFGGVNHLIFIVIGTYLVMFIGLSPNIHLPNFSKYGDFSYGIYIYAFPCQQFFVWLFDGEMSPIINSIFSFVISLALAFLSWHLIEKPSLKLKNLVKT